MNTQSSQESPSKAPSTTIPDASGLGDSNGHSPVKRSLSLFDCVCIIVGTIIGAGIFGTPSTIARLVPNEFWLIVMWCIGGGVALIGALCFAELTTTYPDRGGDYGYLKRAYGRWLGFAFSWAAFWVIRPGNISVMAIVFGIYAKDAFDADVSKVTYALLALGAVSAVNLLGLKAGKWSQNLLAIAKVTGILLILLSALIFVPRENTAPKESQENAKDGKPNAAQVDTAVSEGLKSDRGSTSEIEGSRSTNNSGTSVESSSAESTSAESSSAESETKEEDQESSFNDWFWLALVFVMFSFGGWNDIAFVAGEVRSPEKNLFRSLMLGTLGVLTIYLLFNLALLMGMGQVRMAELESSNAPTEFITLRLGDIGGRLLATLVCISCVGAVSAMIFTSPRIYWATANDYPALRWLAGSRDGTGWRRSMVLQAVVTAVFILVFGWHDNSFDVMVIASAPYFWGFLAMTVIALIVLRLRKDPQDGAKSVGQVVNASGYRTPLFPVLPIVFVLVCLFMAYRALDFMIMKGFYIHAGCIGGWILLGVVASFLMSSSDESKDK